jgi:hypothetical protein
MASDECYDEDGERYELDENDVGLLEEAIQLAAPWQETVSSKTNMRTSRDWSWTRGVEEEDGVLEKATPARGGSPWQATDQAKGTSRASTDLVARVHIMVHQLTSSSAGMRLAGAVMAAV